MPISKTKAAHTILADFVAPLLPSTAHGDAGTINSTVTDKVWAAGEVMIEDVTLTKDMLKLFTVYL